MSALVYLGLGDFGNSPTQRSVLPVPNPNGLVVGTRDNPRKLMMKEDCANIIQMSIQGKKTSASLIGPDLDLVIVSPRNEEGLCLVKVYSSNRAIVLLEPVD